MKFLRFGQSDECSPTLYPVEQIDSIVMYDTPFDNDLVGEFKIILFLKSEDSGVVEYFNYDNKLEMIEAQKSIRSRFDEIEGLLNE